MNKNTKRRQVELRRERIAQKIAEINRTRAEAVPNAPRKTIRNPNA